MKKNAGFTLVELLVVLAIGGIMISVLLSALESRPLRKQHTNRVVTKHQKQQVQYAYADPVGFVNDFASIIPDDEEKKIEGMLKAYEKKTSIEMAVVTTPSLDGLNNIEEWSINLATRWGVGKKGKDNGLLLVIAPNSKKYRLEVGYGLEWQLPDGLVGQLERKHLVPAFKVGDYAGGIKHLIRALFDVLGEHDLQERKVMFTQYKKKRAEHRQRLLEERKEAQKKAQEQRKKTIFTTTLLAIATIFIGALVFFFRQLFKWRAEVRRKKQLILAHTKVVEAELDRMNKEFDEVVKKESTLSEWVRRDLQFLLGKFRVRRKTLLGDIQWVNDFVQTNPDSADDSRQNFDNVLEYLQELLHKMQKAIGRIATYYQKATDADASFSNKFSRVKVQLETATRQGFRLDVGLDSLEERYKTLQAELNSSQEGRNGNVKQSVEDFDDLSAELQDVSDEIAEVVKSHQEVEEKLPKCKKDAKSILEQFEHYNQILDDLRSQCSTETWRDLKSRLREAVSLVRDVNFDFIQQLNSRKTDECIRAGKLLNEAMEKIETAQSLFAEIEKLVTDIQSAKEEYQQLLSEAKGAIQKAVSATSQSNVGRASLRYLADAKENLQEAENLLKRETIDWPYLILLLKSVIVNADNAIKSAKNNIKRIKKAKARARKERNSEKREKRNSGMIVGGILDDDFFSDNSRDSSGGFGGGFDDFGGGGFGGGGASGGWD